MRRHEKEELLLGVPLFCTCIIRVLAPLLRHVRTEAALFLILILSKHLGEEVHVLQRRAAAEEDNTADTTGIYNIYI